MSSKDIDELLEIWNETKTKIADLEKKCDKYKQYCERLMKKMNVDILSGSRYYVSRSQVTRSTMSKKDVPDDVWNKYASKCTYPSYYVKKVK